MVDQDPINRMSEKPELEHLRESSLHPSWWSRLWDRLRGAVTSTTGHLVLMALMIVGAIALWYWVAT